MTPYDTNFLDVRVVTQSYRIKLTSLFIHVKPPYVNDDDDDDNDIHCESKM